MSTLTQKEAKKHMISGGICIDKNGDKWCFEDGLFYFLDTLLDSWQEIEFDKTAEFIKNDEV